MALSKSARRKARRYRAEGYFRYLDRLIDAGDAKAIIAEVRANIESPRAISILEYVRSRRNGDDLTAKAQVALSVWERQVWSLVPCSQALRKADGRAPLFGVLRPYADVGGGFPRQENRRRTRQDKGYARKTRK